MYRRRWTESSGTHLVVSWQYDFSEDGLTVIFLPVRKLSVHSSRYDLIATDVKLRTA